MDVSLLGCHANACQFTGVSHSWMLIYWDITQYSNYPSCQCVQYFHALSISTSMCSIFMLYPFPPPVCAVFSCSIHSHHQYVQYFHALSIPTSACSIPMCPDSGMAVSVWNFLHAHKCWSYAITVLHVRAVQTPSRVCTERYLSTLGIKPAWLFCPMLYQQSYIWPRHCFLNIN